MGCRSYLDLCQYMDREAQTCSCLCELNLNLMMILPLTSHLSRLLLFCSPYFTLWLSLERFSTADLPSEKGELHYPLMKIMIQEHQTGVVRER